MAHGRRLLLTVMSFLAATVFCFQLWEFPSGKYLSGLSPSEEASSLMAIRDGLLPRNSTMNSVFGLVKVSEMIKEAKDGVVVSDHKRSKSDVDLSEEILSVRQFRSVGNAVEHFYVMDNDSSAYIGNRTVYRFIVGDTHSQSDSTKFSTPMSPISKDRVKPLDTRLNTSISTSNFLISTRIKRAVELEAGSKNKGQEASLKNASMMIERYVRKTRGATIPLSEMNSMLSLFNGTTSSSSVRPRSSSPRDRELITANLHIKNAPILRDFPDLHGPLYRNASKFKRSYELMVRLLKIYVYREGERPIFHQPRLRGIYAAEGWFMKLLERSKRFVVKDPKKAHLFYVPFSSELLRMTLYDGKSHSMNILENHLTGYLDLIKKRYLFWNRTGGADHFFVACHDWGPRITRQHMNSCIRALCNANVARGFSIGKDVSVPVTYVRSGNDPIKDIGGKPPSERNILAFFAGQIHGYVRPLLLRYWENKVSDMKILGPMQRDVGSKAVYREYMKSSKYCICARGYGVHTPRVVESIFYECVPVIISDNYVPPFFEVLDWETFAVFIQEKDIPNLRNILLSIPQNRYLDMQMRVKKVQHHFIWHKVPEKYDLFHMILHSIWYSRISQMRPV